LADAEPASTRATPQKNTLEKDFVLNDNSQFNYGSAMGNPATNNGSIIRDPLSDLQNSYSHASYQRQRQMTLGDLLLENRIVFLQGEIHTGNANELVMKLLYLQSENKKKDINFYLNSPGGDVIATLAIYDVMQIMSCPVATFCVGQAASGAAVLLAGGTKGKRFCLPNSRVMIHQPHGGVGGQVSDIEIQADEILRNRTVLNEILSKHTGQTVEKIAKDTDRDFFLTAEQAKDYGVVDELTFRQGQNEDDDDDDD
jgi:ATP-dependent Clp protease protease subunit